MGDIIWKGAWSAETTYAADDAVTHGGSSYMAIDTSTDVEPGVDEGWEGYWDVFAVKGEGFTWRGTWQNGGTAYVLNDVVNADGSSYVCIQAHNSCYGNIQDDLAYWDVLVEKGEDGASFTWQGSWAYPGQYAANDVVESGGSIYICTAFASDDEEPSVSPEHWALMVQKGEDGEDGSNANVDLTNLPTSDPEVEFAPWNDNGTLKFSAGT
jgi:hypothetical protein